MDLGIKGRVALIAASSQGLGRATAIALAQEGAKVVINSRSKTKLEQARREIRDKTNAEVLAIQADLTLASEVTKLVDQTVDAFGTIDILINNAGGPPAGFFSDMTDEHWQAGFDLTLMSSVRLTREVLPFMKKKGWGRIINITSVSVKQPINELLLSNSLRLSVIGWAKTLALQVAAEGILVNNVCPGWTSTDRVGEIIASRAQLQNRTADEIEQGITSGIPMGRMGNPEELASLIAFLASERASYITGTSIQVDGGAVKGMF